MKLLENIRDKQRNEMEMKKKGKESEVGDKGKAFDVVGK